MTVKNPPMPGQTDYRPAFDSDVRRDVRPTAAQLERRQRRRRFNRRVIYFPVGLTLLAWLTIVGGLLWLTIVGDWFAMDTNQAYYRQQVSGVADLLTMIMLAPLLLLCAVPSVGAVALFVARRQREKDATSTETSLPLLWRVENIVITVHDAIARTLPRVARPVIDAHAVAAFVNRFIIVIKRTISQEISGNDDYR